MHTHTAHLSSFHPPLHGNGPPNVQLFERGYNKDAAGIAIEAIHYGNYCLSIVTMVITLIMSILGCKLLHCVQ